MAVSSLIAPFGRARVLTMRAFDGVAGCRGCSAAAAAVVVGSSSAASELVEDVVRFGRLAGLAVTLGGLVRMLRSRRVSRRWRRASQGCAASMRSSRSQSEGCLVQFAKPCARVMGALYARGGGAAVKLAVLDLRGFAAVGRIFQARQRFSALKIASARWRQNVGSLACSRHLTDIMGVSCPGGRGGRRAGSAGEK